MQKMKEYMQKSEITTPRRPPFFTRSNNPPKRDAFGTLSIVRFTMCHSPIWPCGLLILDIYNFKKIIKLNYYNFASMLKQFQCKNKPIFESDNLVYTTLQYYCISGKYTKKETLLKKMELVSESKRAHTELLKLQKLEFATCIKIQE